MKPAGEIEVCISSCLGERVIRMTPGDLVNWVRKHLPEVSRREIIATIRQMVQSGDLMYTQHLSTTHLEKGVVKPIQVSDRLVVCQANRAIADENILCLRVDTGTSFGAGDHPTTLLSLRAMEFVKGEFGKTCLAPESQVLDIGSGTGILAIAAVLLGAGHAVGVDIDNTACHEASRNSALNGVADKVEWVHGDLGAVRNRRYDLLLANLRPPTLVSLFDQMAALTRWDGTWILSGFRPESLVTLEDRWPMEFEKLWENEERGWAAVVLQRKRERKPEG